MKKLLFIASLTLLVLWLSILQNVQAATATLSWTPPTQNIDGSPLTDLDHYVLKFGNSKTTMDNPVKIGKAIKKHIFTNLKNKTYYFVIFAINAKGISSGPSNIVSKSFRVPKAPVLSIQ